ncbi:hypothetical protein BDZ91DRAFT_776975 [Kalaharituber pfeilii]|nr:hypothetical protein BDZ91DRAFT_776975 [Kalaharituber pfeilii]
MPMIKFPKFSRRKTAGNSLEAAYEPANTGSPLRPGFEDYDSAPREVNPYGTYGGHYNINNNNRGRGSGSGSGYSGGGYYGSDSSNRLSSSSTLPSADFPQTPRSTDDHFGSRRSAGGGGGGGHSTSSSHMDQNQMTPSSVGKRSVGGQFSTSPPRKMTLSSTEPPRLETKLDSTSFEDMFSGFDVNNPTGIEELSPTAPKLATTLMPPVSSESPGGYNSGNASMKKAATRIETQGPSPPPKSYNPATVLPKVQGVVKKKVQTWNTYSQSQNMYSTEANGSTERWAGRPSEEGLISPQTEDKPKTISPRQSRNLTHSTPNPSPAPSHSRKDSLTAPPRNTRLPRTGTGDLKRSSAVMRRHSIPTDDEDAAVVTHNIQRVQGNSPSGPRGLTDRMKDRDSGWEENVGSGSSSVNSIRDNASSASSKDTSRTSVTSPRSPATARIKMVNEKSTSITTVTVSKRSVPEQPGVELRDGSDTEFDSSISAAVQLAARYEDDSTETPKVGPKKVMTKAQFERYRQQQEEERMLRGKDKSDSDSESDEEYDSDTERNKEIIRQRQKQEAHLSVYRQQMMKITGSTSSSDALNGPSAPMLSLNNSMPQLSLSTPDGGSDEDEDTPLGILMAHGFPNKNRPPSKLTNSSSQPNLRGAAQQHAMEGAGGRLPVFARNLPADPYNYGAGLVNPPNRLGGGTGSVAGGSVYGGSVYGGGSTGRHPGGLIGEIALAEEMKAARRHGSGLGGYPRPSGGMLGLGGGGIGPNGMGMMGGMAPMMGMDPSQMQMQQQMQQMMQMQMQWMQQMQAQQQMMQNGLNPPMMGLPRPNSIAVPQAPAMQNPAMHQRTMSMVDPMLGGFGKPPQSRPGYAPSIAPSIKMMPPMMPGGQPGYTPSIAPSERSTIGLPSRYRPVSQVPPLNNDARTWSMGSTLGHNWQQQKPGSSGLKAVVKKADDDDDDDSAWEEMEKKKREKKEGWKKRKDLKDILSFNTNGSASATTITSS